MVIHDVSDESNKHGTRNTLARLAHPPGGPKRFHTAGPKEAGQLVQEYSTDSVANRPIILPRSPPAPQNMAHSIQARRRPPGLHAASLDNDHVHEKAADSPRYEGLMKE
jgi:hypothetical protein